MSTLDISSIHYLTTSAAYTYRKEYIMKAIQMELVSVQLGKMTEDFVAILMSTVQ